MYSNFKLLSQNKFVLCKPKYVTKNDLPVILTIHFIKITNYYYFGYFNQLKKSKQFTQKVYCILRSKLRINEFYLI